MRAMKCDRCCKLYEHYDGGKEFKDGENANGLILFDRDLDGNHRYRMTYDLCPECMKGLEDFIKIRRKRKTMDDGFEED